MCVCVSVQDGTDWDASVAFINAHLANVPVGGIDFHQTLQLRAKGSSTADAFAVPVNYSVLHSFLNQVRRR